MVYDETFQIYVPRVGRIRKKVLIIGCPHHPFMNWELFRSIVEEHSDMDECIVNGDLMDQYSMSTFVRDRVVAITDEYRQALEMVDLLSRTFKKVTLTLGNHDKRFAKRLGSISTSMADSIHRLAHSSAFAPDGVFLIPLSRGIEFDDNGFEIGNRGFDNVVFEPGPQAWWTQVGKTIVCHPDSRSGSKFMSLVVAWHRDYFAPRYRDRYDSIILHHTHKGGKLMDKDTLLIEGGCLCDPPDYAVSGKMRLDASHLGYVLLYQDSDGNTDFDATRFVFSGIGSEPGDPYLEEVLPFEMEDDAL